ncbi:MAG: hypothetical protein JWN40_4077 [Phycisphaerales bacterium]|nr:hypothetical protein [Phycisphaerales bacterium]
MKNRKSILIAAAALVALGLTGCSHEPAAPAPSASSMSPTPAATNMNAASPMKGMPVMTDSMPDKDCSHVLVEDAPVFLTMPGQGVAPVGILKSGSKVLAMVPGSMYTKCMMAGNKTVYIKTASLKPTTN